MSEEIVSFMVTLLAIISPLAALVFGYFSFNHARKKGEREEASQMTTVLIKLETISDNVRDIKSDIHDVKQDLGALAERVAKVEAAVEAAHHRIDEISK